MYIPPQFEVTNPETIATVIHQYGFASLVSRDGETMNASHVPLMLQGRAASGGQLHGHLAAANPQLGQLQDQKVLAMFHGPHAYISPKAYAAASVPTWNFIAVHVTGTARRVDETWLEEENLSRLVAQYEGDASMMDELEPKKLDALKAAIGHFVIDIETVQAKFKLSQNKSLEDRARIINDLRERDDSLAHAIAEEMARDL
ncbi:MAG: FMN-binding negative transcriptional regulator [Rhodobiaceae bacterium]|nr:FMN-binding negative transcriptional regulator [Rhodobiaceae bacterium]